MKIDRRSFLSFGIGGAVGTALSPLPWKLTDDLSIWTQNWPWTPVPPEGEVTYLNSVCTLCPGGCGITVRKVNDRAVKIEGMAGHPVNDGGICILGLSGLQLLYGPTRVKTPLKRAGERGAGRWQQISWSQAVTELTERLGKLRENGQSHTVAGIMHTDRGTVSQLFQRFLTAYGSPNFFRTPSMQDSYELALYLMHGVLGSAAFDAENADFVLSFGSGYIEGWGSPVHMFRANTGWKKDGARVVQLEPRLSLSAAKANKWLPINPGTEAALALSLAHVIIQEGLYDSDFVEKKTSGFDTWKKQVADYAPEKAADITGISAPQIVSLAKDFAGAKHPLAICGRGQGRRTPGSLHEAMAVHALNGLVGAINRRGGVWIVPNQNYIAWPEPELDQTAAEGLQKGRIDGAGGEQYPMARYLLSRLPEVISSEKSYSVQALLVSGANPLYSLPDSSAVKAAFEKIPFIASFSSFMDETAAFSDLILPNHIYLECHEDVPTPLGLAKPIIGLCKPVVEPQFNTRHFGDVIIEAAQAMGDVVAAAFPWENYQTCLEETLQRHWKFLLDKGYRADSETLASAKKASFDTASGKFEFSNKATASQPLYNPVALEGDEATYPLVLIPYDTMRLASGYIGNPPFLVKSLDDTILKGNDVLVEINPQTAKEAGLSEGSYAVLTTEKGRAEVKVHLYDGIMPGVVALPRGLGHTAYDKYLANKGVNFNELIGPIEDPASGLDAAWGIRVKLAKA